MAVWSMNVQKRLTKRPLLKFTLNESPRAQNNIPTVYISKLYRRSVLKEC